jgi:hypothetical protein
MRKGQYIYVTFEEFCAISDAETHHICDAGGADEEYASSIRNDIRLLGSVCQKWKKSESKSEIKKYVNQVMKNIEQIKNQ